MSDPYLAHGLVAAAGTAILGLLAHWWHRRRRKHAPAIVDPQNTLPVIDAARDEAAQVLDVVADAIEPPAGNADEPPSKERKNEKRKKEKKAKKKKKR